MQRWRRSWVAMVVPLAAVFGCGSGEEAPQRFPVTGIVKLNGEPVEGASVTFVPQDRQGGRSAVGRTDSSGKYTLTTMGGGDGALPGKYQVKIEKYEEPVAPKTAGTAVGGGEDANYLPPDDNDPAAMEQQKNLLPEKYADPTRSGFTATIVEGENPSQDFNLEEG